MSTALRRLSSLDEVFHVRDLMKNRGKTPGLDASGARRFLAQMVEARFVQPAGPRLGFYYNLLRNARAPHMRALYIVGQIYAEAIAIGPNVLHHYGWIQECSECFHVAVSRERERFPKIQGVEIHPRSREWFKSQHRNDAILSELESPFEINCLTPRAALDDMRSHDDISIPQFVSIPQDENAGIFRLPEIGQDLRPLPLQHVSP